ncbi:tetrapyrrole-binding protein, chloroplastic [Telopea speciosissima]|uniref:tetrapyrrole-binding protein, chloroplastic n=1 Tax=Telopea speciosissima TaxID=54955 RepID=UPI001CC82A39|nr:tetrapyrrole-binding protein, chloroplastic [Telopea speciosissima]
MATNSLQSLHRYPLSRRQHSDSLPSTLPSSLFLKPTTTTTTITSSTSLSLHKLCSTNFTIFSTTSTTTTPTSQTLSFDTLQHHLSSKDYRQADEETRRLLIVLAGEAAQERGYVFFSEVQFISESNLQTIDNLWRQYSNNKFGYSVQKRIWGKVNRDFTRFFMKVGWMKKLDTEVEQYNYRSFPSEFVWELKDDTPEGHLPLTNALRGTQLLKRILSHPAFQSMEEEEDDNDGNKDKGADEMKQNPKPGDNKRLSKSDYSF